MLTACVQRLDLKIKQAPQNFVGDSLGTRSGRPDRAHGRPCENPRGLEFKVVGYLLDSPEGEVPGANGGKAARGEGRSRPPPDETPGPGEEGSGPPRGAGLARGVSFRHAAWGGEKCRGTTKSGAGTDTRPRGGTPPPGQSAPKPARPPAASQLLPSHVATLGPPARAPGPPSPQAAARREAGTHAHARPRTPTRLHAACAPTSAPARHAAGPGSRRRAEVCVARPGRRHLAARRK